MRKVLTLFFVVGLISASHAQFGLRAGFSSSNFSDTNYKANPGFHGGVYYTLGTESLAIEPGVQFSQRGFETNAIPSGAVVTESLDYVDFPLLVRLYIFPVLNVFAGPQYSKLISRKREEPGDVQTDMNVLEQNDFAGVVGISASPVPKLNFQISYDMGFSNLNYYGRNVKNQVLKLSVSFDLYSTY
ncbi:Outer membrane protein beta-barrel domain-containing protein [Algoriphagus ornithinivorans]|jgi:hypothetical protein|uniref:Outer membrane protein beta-barrel domain-containing protein n=1 Tax=Algoriphagus ornithinivorans TaxID=226506 RepID=A0A1I5ACL1_9BACT|nr:porin family protein [Algoriphagus ornithinivorans]SFN60128.1 Outer membrane protein beta-barrel domain-containing protein [Algoriphagus ornithinivorans]